MKAAPILAIIPAIISFTLSSCNRQTGELDQKHHQVTAATPQVRDVMITERYVGHIRSHRHINVRAVKTGYLEAIPIQEGQAVKTDDVMFKVRPVLLQSRLDAEQAEVQRAQVEFDFAKKQYEDKVVSQIEVAKGEARLARAEAGARRAAAELDFATVKAPFDGIVDRLQYQQGSLVQEGDILTTLSDNSLMWVYFDVPEARYLTDMAGLDQHQEKLQFELVLANGNTFDQVGRFGAIAADFNHETGNVAFRADFPNPRGLLRHGQTGTVLMHRVLQGALVIPQRATFEILDKRYVVVVDRENVVHEREIIVRNEAEETFVIEKGLDQNDRIILDGIRQISDGEKVEFEVRQSQQ